MLKSTWLAKSPYVGIEYSTMTFYTSTILLHYTSVLSYVSDSICFIRVMN